MKTKKMSKTKKTNETLTTRPIIVYYINVGKLNNEDATNFVRNSKEIIGKLDGMVQYFIPIRNGETKIECIYPSFISNDDFFKENMIKLKKLNEVLKEYPHENILLVEKKNKL